MSESHGPVRSFWNAAILIAGACLLLVIAVKLLSVIWPWLLAAALLSLAIWIGVVWVRWRRSRW